MTLPRVRDLMSTDLVTLNADDDFKSVTDVLALKHVRHLPVVRGKRLVGLVTQRDLLRAQAKLFVELAQADPKGTDERVINVNVSEFMTSEDLVTCNPATPADDAARMMLDRKLGCVLVVDNDLLVGIVTEADMVKWSAEMISKLRLEQGSGTKLQD